jgi:DNA modification methylase
VRVTPYYTDPLVTLLHGDCIKVMAGLEADSVDAMVTDPPYGLEFMGKEWDRFGGVVEAAADSPGWRAGHGGLGGASKTNGVPFGGGGQRVRYSNAGAPFQAWCEQWGREALRVTKPGGYLLAFGGTRTHHRLVCALEDAGWIIRDELTWIYASGFPKGKANLKPAHEPIVLARKPGPLRPLGIDECRIGFQSEAEVELVKTRSGGKGGAFAGDIYGDEAPGYRVDGERFANVNPSGRWPSNVLLSDPELFDEPNPYVVGSGATSVSGAAGKKGSSGFAEGYDGEYDVPYGDSGGYSRFFIIPKADRAERERGLADRPKTVLDVNAGRSGKGNLNGTKQADGGVRDVLARANVHPTVKPIDLMRHLVRLVTPNGGTVLDPFLGSGTTALAASEEGFRCIGIEREAEYLEIAKGRLMATPMGLGLE